MAVLKSVTIASLKAGMSSGFRLDPMFPSTTTCSSTQRAPAFLRSVSSAGHEVIRRPFTAPVSITAHGLWQMTATGLPVSVCADARTLAHEMRPVGAA
jgi:hypothetical protein